MDIRITHVIELSAPLMALLAASAAPGSIAAATLANDKRDPIMPEVAARPIDAEPAAGASQDAPEVDAHGHPWSADLHASTRGVTKEGLWRMKVGVTRPDPLPGFPISAGSTSTQNTGATGSSANSDAAAGGAGTVEEDDEFAAFAAAAADGNKPEVKARTWTDADLSKLTNQAAVKLGNPEPVKALIAQYAAEGETAHSRNIPADKREEFARALEEKAGIEYAAD